MSLAQQGVMESLRGRPCWVVGCGFLGSCLAAACREAGMPVLSIDCEHPADVQGDAREHSLLAAAKERLLPETIFCCAATHGGDDKAYRSTYIDLPRALREACPQARMIFCSSSSVYARQDGGLVTEGSPTPASSPRLRLLHEAEAAVLEHGGKVARLVPLYGEGRCELLRRFVCGEPELPGGDNRWLNYVHREDAAQALLLIAARTDAPHIVNVCGDIMVKGEVYAALARLTGLKRRAAASVAGRRGSADQRVSAERLRALGWQPKHMFLDWAARHWLEMKGGES